MVKVDPADVTSILANPVTHDLACEEPLATARFSLEARL